MGITVCSGKKKKKKIRPAVVVCLILSFYAPLGVGNINDVELKGIANDPDSDYYYYVSDYVALQSITDRVASEACEVGKGLT